LLSDWARCTLVNRTDRYGGQVVSGDGTVKRTTYWQLSHELLVQHFEAGVDAGADEIIGLHVAAPDETCRWIGIDIDRHGDEDPAANLRFAIHVLRRCLQQRLVTVLLDSSGGRGGYHLWILFDRPIPMADARRLVLWLATDWEPFGLPKSPDLFPGSGRLVGKLCGTWLRLPGRHHKRPDWSTVWSPQSETWLEGGAAIQALLSLQGKPVEVTAIVPAGFGQPQRPALSAPPVCGLGHDDAELDLVLARARDALRFYPDDTLAYDRWLEIVMALRQFDEPGRRLCHQWSASSPKYDAADLDRRWESFRGGDEDPSGAGRLITVATLFKRAQDAGWPGPSVQGLHYPVDFRSRHGPVFVVQGRAAFRALDERGHLAIGLPDRDQPSLRKIDQLLGDDSRELVVVGTWKPFCDAESIARVLGGIRRCGVKVIWPPEPFEDVPTWIRAVEENETAEMET
jgi:hypothetical protein